ncbi:ribonuclease HII [bacterium]|nr:ribonuclease HII [bacterium]
MTTLVEFDRECSQAGALLVAGVDEAGRGAWAGPVVAAAVILPPDWVPDGLDDSKRLDPLARERIAGELRQRALAWAACAVSAREIDDVNVLRATLRAMARSVGRLRPVPDLVLVDGLQVPEIACEARALIKGDGTSACIAAASILAKVLRDRVMTAWDRRHPLYGFATHKGYGASRHRLALRAHGPCPLHRRSYRPVAEVAQTELWNDSC